ncbi:PEP-CTERM sorting domain-containing protein [Massilia sp. YMA4]|uniref:PEP-CTERM sorting domain-containing protein n=1 Tax=Massilia sp. YMA4 TaxID=1593482 RepID=UPI000DD0F085|nr:PEP-CTERM sorting domain-containing protein [Massilia sp. YMA4]AXA90494.1 hypothetical protein DPH57_04490 [Massilia sp. YMA4]
MRKLPGLMLAAACVVSQPALARTMNVDFNTTPGADGKFGTGDDAAMPAQSYPGWIREELAPAGIHFTDGNMVRSAFFDGNARNVFLSAPTFGAYFDRPVYGVSVDTFAKWGATLTGFDVAGNVVATDSFVNDEQQYAYAVLALSGRAAIYRIAVHADHPDHILNLDNMVLTVAPVPEPAQYALFGIGLAALGIAARCRNKKLA